MTRKESKSSRSLFRDPSGQVDMFEKSYEEELEAKSQAPVTCLGLIFENDRARRAHFLGLLSDGLEELEKRLRGVEFTTVDDAVQQLSTIERWPLGDEQAIQKLASQMGHAESEKDLLERWKDEVGFPVGKTEDILKLSDPPYYTACPNPFVTDFIYNFGIPYNQETDDYHRKPFAADVSEGKNGPIYNAHTYHTKVPHKAIMRYILHYSKAGDLVFDGFSGTGMTGVASQLCGDPKAIEGLGYSASEDGTIQDEDGEPISNLGVRHTVLNDVSPAASFIAANYNLSIDVQLFQGTARDLLQRFGDDFGWMYETKHGSSETKGRINFTIWSDVFICNHCQEEVVFWNVAVEQGTVKDKAQCPHCSAEISKSSLDRASTLVMDEAVGKPVPRARQVPVLINYSVDGKKHEKEPDDFDLQLLERVKRTPVEDWYPTRRIDEDIDLWYERDYRALGIYSVDAFFSRRNLIMTAWFRREIESISHDDNRLGAFLWFWFESVLMGFSKLNRYRTKVFSQVNQILSGTLYVGAIQSEVSPWYALQARISRYSVFEKIKGEPTLISTSSTAYSDIPDSSLDYIFVDPPFGSNIIYSDLSIIWESWLRLFTNSEAEAVVHRRKKKGAFSLNDYAQMMAECFVEMFRALKPARWITVVFHNSQNSVWTAIQEALSRAGFVIADVRTLDKQMQTFKQVTAAGAVKQDLVISAYRPSGGLENRFKLIAGTEDGAWDFTRTHLMQLPVFVSNDGQLEVVAERQSYLLFDRMVAFHVQRGVTVPLSAAEFYAGLAQRFPERDGMYFLPEQAAEYDKKRLTVKEVQQLQLFVTDEESSILWLKQQLSRKPQTFQELHPQFLKEIGGWQKHEIPLELSELLEQNFLRHEGKGEVPSQIHSYLSSNYKDLRNLPKDDEALHSKAKDRWYVPDPNKQADLEKLRERTLLREFEEYREAEQKRLKIFRLEAVRAGFKKGWQEHDYATIIAVAEKIPEKVLQEDPKLLMWYDQAITRNADA